MLSDEDLAALDRRFEREPPSVVVRWVVETFHPRVCVAASMTDAVLIDVAVRVEPNIEVVFVDTGFHFPETLEMTETVTRRYGLNLRVLRTSSAPDPRWSWDADGCCSVAKVAQLDRALDGKDAWMSGLRRADSPTRATAPIVARDARGLVKVNPLATWSDLDVERYIAEHDVPVNPLVAKGYRSIGCWPCTRPTAPHEDPRAGRWPGSPKVECGLHL